MAISDLFLASIVVFALLGIASATADIETRIGVGRGLQREDNSGVVRIEGIIYCLREQQQKLLPMKGASAMVSCIVTDGKGNKTYLHVTPETNEKGYYTINLTETTPEGYILDPEACLVTLNTPPPDTDCIYKSNFNDGISSVLLSDLNPTRLPHNSTLYSIDPFVFLFYSLFYTPSALN